MSKQNSWFETTVAELADPHDQRVWSVIVSLFGDMAQEPGTQISGGALTRIIEPMGIKPEAIRVALHRLRKDGWIESDRIGRVSRHVLSEFGRTQSAAVTPRIYARGPTPAERWHLLIAQEGTTQVLEDVMLSHDYIPISRSVALGSGPAPDQSDGLLGLDISPRTAPTWLQDRLCPKDLRKSCQALLDAVERATRTRPENWSPAPLQSATLRTLLVHRWRRVVLRQPDLPVAFYPPDWAGPACRDSVFNLLDTLPRPPAEALSGTG
ncbi:PaaX family transcriptional regulator [Ruegeria sp. ANG-R]|uniref:PaaX family transcriptional regulator C-terminal domain-containing protein n=1 Tax=Ruegeria sp. ANG-R TaxID=1577903 RepID=UPI0005809281|nr:PaaX family transcriptional regulator C-terminal domain-containing protein [Ruegeria sp. ANG-R]KIC38175.1 PaaX family transcriptional regulator [Ruegeria sp. ANG-R]